MSRQTWYSSFVNPINGKDSLKNIAKPTTFCVSKEHEGSRQFALYKTPLAFYKDCYINGGNRRHFFECIRDGKQKIYFDIDVNLKKHPEVKDFKEMGKNIVVDLIKSSIKAAKDFNFILTPDDFAIFSSHGENKISYHVVTHNHKVGNNRLNRMFFEKTKTYIDNRYIDFIDSKVYSTFQQFRLLGSSKEGTDRIKSFVFNFQHRDIVIKHQIPKDRMNNQRSLDYYIFEKSLITWNDDCIQIFIEDNQISEVKMYDTYQISNEDVLYIKQIIGSSYEIRKIEGNMVSLMRIKAAKCTLCDREHENDNPFITIVGGNIRFHCRRADNSKYLNRGMLPSSMEKLTLSRSQSKSRSTKSMQELSPSEAEFMRSFSDDLIW